MFLSFEGETNNSGFFSLSVLSGRKHIFKSPSVPDLEKAPAELVDRTTNNMCFFSLRGHMPREEGVIKEAEKKIRDGKKSHEGSIRPRCGSRQQGGWVPVFPAGHLLKSVPGREFSAHGSMPSTAAGGAADSQVFYPYCAQNTRCKKHPHV